MIKKPILMKNNKDKIIGYFFEGEDPKTHEKLISVSRVNGFINPFPPIISPIAVPWHNKTLRRKQQETEQTALDKLFGASVYEQTFYEAVGVINDWYIQESKYTWDLGNETEELFYDIIKVGKENYISKNVMSLPKTLAVKMIDKLEELGSYELVDYQLELADTENRTMGKIDFILRNKETNKLVLVDTKTGSKIKADKLFAVTMQLVGCYYPLVSKYYKEEFEDILVIAGIYDEYETFDKQKEFFKRAEIVSLKNEDKEMWRKRFLDSIEFMKKIESWKK